MSRGPKHGDMGVDWDAHAEWAAKHPYPYTEGSFFNYFRDLIEPNTRVLEVGCGIAAWYHVWVDIEPTVQYEGLDWSPVAIEIARKRYPHLKFYLMDARDMNFCEEYDVVFTHTFYQHTSIETKRIVVPKVWKALKWDGLHIIQENTACDSLGTWLIEGWIRFFESQGFKIIRTHDIGGGGTGFVFEKQL
jgi:SAM-dependent methyltransferase